MITIHPTRSLATGIVLLVALATSNNFALAQTAGTTSQITSSTTAATPAKAIGAAPANSHQHVVLQNALSPQTRQTLQAAMDSYDDSDSHSAHK